MSTPPVIERFSRFSTGWCDHVIDYDLFASENEHFYVYPNGLSAAKKGFRTYYKTYAEARQAIIAKATEDLEAGRAFVVRQTAILERANAIPAEQPASLNTSSN